MWSLHALIYDCRLYKDLCNCCAFLFVSFSSLVYQTPSIHINFCNHLSAGCSLLILWYITRKVSLCLDSWSSLHWVLFVYISARFIIPLNEGSVILYLFFDFQKENLNKNWLNCGFWGHAILLQSRPDRYVALFGEFSYDPSKWRPSVPFVEQLKACKELIDEGKVTNWS